MSKSIIGRMREAKVCSWQRLRTSVYLSNNREWTRTDGVRMQVREFKAEFPSGVVVSIDVHRSGDDFPDVFLGTTMNGRRFHTSFIVPDLPSRESLRRLAVAFVRRCEKEAGR